ncbi:TetR/AcrR family transcriptional regulator [Ectothiorhodospiraceae bacterium 2226]|nr:TetR/AcrR family transcriptional regulator [Ectothiorhodospiraceae bacterium 2226]
MAPTPESAGCSAVDRILDAACELFSEHGFDHVSMSAVAGRAGVSKANVFHHFSSKDALYIAALRAACRTSREAIERLSQEEGSPRERIRRFAAMHLASLIDNERDARLLQREVMERGHSDGRHLAEDVFADGFARLVELVAEGQRCGELDDAVPPALLATLILSANVFFFQTRDILRHLPRVDFADAPETYNKLSLDLLLGGCRPKEAS